MLVSFLQKSMSPISELSTFDLLFFLQRILLLFLMFAPPNLYLFCSTKLGTFFFILFPKLLIDLFFLEILEEFKDDFLDLGTLRRMKLLFDLLPFFELALFFFFLLLLFCLGARNVFVLWKPYEFVVTQLIISVLPLFTN